MTYSRKQEALRSPAARKERRTSLLLGASLMFAISVCEPLYRPFNGPLLAVRMVWCASLVAIGLALPRASTRTYGVLLPLAGVSTCWLFTATVWLNGGVASPDFQYIMLFPLGLMVIFQDEVVACAATVVADIVAIAALSWLCDAPVPLIASRWRQPRPRRVHQ